MTRRLPLVTCVAVALALAWPSGALAQAGRRSGGESGGTRSGPGTGGTAVPRSAPPAPAPVETPRSTGSSRPSGSAGASRSPGSGDGSRVTGSGARSRGSQAVRGMAQPRTNAPRGGGDVYIPWYSYSPWYGDSSFYFGSYAYRGPYRSYGLYDPFFYDPFGYYGAYGFGGAWPYYWAPPVSAPARRAASEATGSLRLKVNPKDARVYIDGALAGIADDFDGLTNHLELAPGPHQIELRADGFQPYTGQIDVREGRTRTERVSLKRP